MNTNHENKKMVMFDFDGVLANTLEYSYQIHKVKNAGFTWERFQSYSDGNFHDGYEKAVADGEHIPADDFYGEYSKHLEKITTHDILHDAVLSLATKYTLVVVSSTSSIYIKNYLNKENLLECFSEIFGADVHKSKVIKIKSLLEKYNLVSRDAVFVTDSLGDIKEANDCGVLSVGVTWGIHSKEALQKGNPATIVDDPQDLAGAIENVLK